MMQIDSHGIFWDRISNHEYYLSFDSVENEEFGYAVRFENDGEFQFRSRDLSYFDPDTLRLIASVLETLKTL